MKWPVTSCRESTLLVSEDFGGVRVLWDKTNMDEEAWQDSPTRCEGGLRVDMSSKGPESWWPGASGRSICVGVDFSESHETSE